MSSRRRITNSIRKLTFNVARRGVCGALALSGDFFQRGIERRDPYVCACFRLNNSWVGMTVCGLGYRT
jgi:hypothetical protein